MLRVPTFESTAVVTDSAALAARLSALFVRPGHFLPITDGPRMTRIDASNEIIRRVNALVFTQAKRLLVAGLSPAASEAMSAGWKHCTLSDDFEVLAASLIGVVKRRPTALQWGQTNLGVGLYKARLSRQELCLTLETSPETSFVEAGTHLLVACECGDELSEVIASNLAFSCNASFATFPTLTEEERDTWLEEIYSLAEGGDVSSRFLDICLRARAHLPDLPYGRFKNILFVTSGFPWGIAVPESPTTHMYRYPDFGRAVIEGIWASRSAATSARTALLIDPQKVEGSEISAINQSLLKNGTLTRGVKGPAASVARVQILIETLPHDIIVISTHAGDAPGRRVTYEYDDSDGRRRKLTVDHVMGLGYDPVEDKFLLQHYHRFHSLDGVDWADREAKAALPVGSAIHSWMAFDDIVDREKHVTHSEEIPRVVGSMAMQLHDGIWIAMFHGFTPGAAPVILNNACSSWHELGQRLTFAGARGYIGTLFPITDAEAQEMGQALFGAHIGKELPKAVWLAQRNLYGMQGRRPYVVVGVPFISIRPNISGSVSFLISAYEEGIAEWTHKSATSVHKDIQENAARFAAFLRDDLNNFCKSLRIKQNLHRK